LGGRPRSTAWGLEGTPKKTTAISWEYAEEGKALKGKGLKKKKDQFVARIGRT